MNQTDKPQALLLVSTHCPYCHALEKQLREQAANGALVDLEVINIEQSPEVAQQHGVRSVPWLQLGNFIFDEAPTPLELDNWIKEAKQDSGRSHYISYLLERGKLTKAVEWLEAGNATLKDAVSILKDSEAKINVRVGVGAILEHFENSESIRTAIPDLIALLNDASPTTRIDACHYLSLTHSIDAIEPLKQMLNDDDEQVREVAQESLEELLK